MESVNRPLRAGCREVSCELALKERIKITRRRIAKAVDNPPSPQAKWEAEARVFVATQMMQIAVLAGASTGVVNGPKRLAPPEAVLAG